jgi:integrase
MSLKGRSASFHRAHAFASLTTQRRHVWNLLLTRRCTMSRGTKGKLVGQKAPLKQREIWAIRIRLQLQRETRELALFNLAIASKLRSCDLVRLRVSNVCQGGRVASRAIVMQRKTQRPVQFEITEQTRESLSSWIRHARLGPDNHVFSSRRTCPPANTHESSVGGCRPSDSIQLRTVRTRCGGPSRH